MIHPIQGFGGFLPLADCNTSPDLVAQVDTREPSEHAPPAMSERCTYMAQLIFYRLVQTLELIVAVLLAAAYYVCKVCQLLGSVRFTVYLAFPTLTTLLAYFDAQVCQVSRMIQAAATPSVSSASSWADGKLTALRKQRQRQRLFSLAHTLEDIVPADLAKEVLDYDIGYSRCADDKERDVRHSVPNVTFMELFKASNRALFCGYH